MDIPTVCAIGEQYIAAMAIGEHNAAKTCDLLYTRVGVREVMKRNNNNNHAMTYLMVSISPGLRYHPFPMRMGIKVLGEFAHSSVIKPQKTEEEGELVLWGKRGHESRLYLKGSTTATHVTRSFLRSFSS